jgi:beta-lactamase class A
MMKASCLFITLVILFVGTFDARAQKRNKIVAVRVEKPGGIVFFTSDALQSLVDKAAQETISKFSDKGFKSENLSITLIDLNGPQPFKMASYRGNEKIYPASVVKMFYMVAVHRWLEEGKIKETDELKRAMREMIVDSWNEPTQYIVDVLTGTTSGPELPPAEMKKWAYKRNAVNRYFASLGYTNINVCQKTYCEDAYGREQVFRNKGQNRNMLTTDAVARLLAEIAIGQAVSRERSAQMMELMKRDPFTKGGLDDQSRGFTGIALKQGMKLWSKAGWTSATRHDAAYIETPDGDKFALVTFTTNFANEREIIPTVARVVLEGIGKVR